MQLFLPELENETIKEWGGRWVVNRLLSAAHCLSEPFMAREVIVRSPLVAVDGLVLFPACAAIFRSLELPCHRSRLAICLWPPSVK